MTKPDLGLKDATVPRRLRRDGALPPATRPLVSFTMPGSASIVALLLVASCTEYRAAATQEGCAKDGDCPSARCDTKTNTCVPTCTDGTRNGTDTCAPTCTDGVRNGSESDTDCGGSCPNKCALGKACKTTADCVSGTCAASGVCAGIVTDALVVHFDMANRASYPGSGNTITNLVPNGVAGSLVNGVGYDDANGGSLVFDGIDDHVRISHNDAFKMTSSASLSVWYKGSANTGLVVCYDKVDWWGYAMPPNGASYCGKSGGNDFIRNWDYTLNTWVMVTWVVDRTAGSYSLFVNSTKNGASAPITHPALTSSVPLYLGARGWVPDNFFKGKIAYVAFYEKALSLEDIRQNYDALKSRYGL